MSTAPVPQISYPSELPISARREELLGTLGDHQVVVVEGETGSGKSTQLPKLCLELGRGAGGLIGHTQPRRIAARSIAERVAAELGGQVGELVGYTVRFTDQVGPRTRVKVMTDGVLLAELQRDRELRRYDTLIIDEAHERSLNIDFLLGYLRRLLPRRPDLKLVITSATIDTERFSRHFDDAPVVTVSGRTHPVEIRYRPLDEALDDRDEPRDQPAAICDAVEELFTETEGDVLVFCSGEREIRDAVDALGDLRLPATEIVPLYARLSSADQHRVFEPHDGRRVVVATNVAETSLTVPGIRSVVDPGTARVSRYNRRTKVQRLPIEDISRASADQRAGRCGRLGPGICIRLYSEESYESRPAFTEPEIARTNLASVILQMAALGLGDIEGFPFVDPPDGRNIRDGVTLLGELGAVRAGRQGRRGWLTPVGRKLARLPVDPRLGRMLVAAHDGDCLADMLVIAAALAIQDPRDRPERDRQAADEMHARFVEPGSDFLTYSNLWDYLRDEQRSGSSSRFRRLCRREFLNYARVREWQDVHGQLRRVASELGMSTKRAETDPDAIHRAILTGLVTQVGRKEEDGYDYRGPRGIRFAIAPGSALFKKAPRWVMAGELSETNRLWARTVARIRPEWIEQAAPHLMTRSYSEPEWDRGRGTAVAVESVSLHGLPLVSGRTIQWSHIDPDDARDLFIRHALLANDWDHHHAFMVRNLDRVAELHRLEAKARRTDLMVDEAALVDWFAARLPGDIVSSRHFDAWWKHAGRDAPHLLDLPLEDLLDPHAEAPTPELFPDQWNHGDLSLSLSYEFDPASSTDGMTVEIPARALHRVGPDTFDWLVPGLRRELVTSLLRGMPKSQRRPFVPLPETVEHLMAELDPSQGPIIDVLRRRLSDLGGTEIPAGALRLDDLPIHLRPNYRVVDDDGAPIAVGGDLSALGGLLRRRLRSALQSTTHPLERDGLTDWTFGDLPRRVVTTGAGHEAAAFPSLVDEGESVAIRLLASPDEQHLAMWTGTRRLLLLRRPALSRTLRALLTDEAKLALVHGPYAGPAEWFEDLLSCAVDALMVEAGGPVWDEPAWVRLRDRVHHGLPERVAELGRTSAALLDQHRRLERLLSRPHAEKLQPSFLDIRYQLDALVYPGFLTGLTAAHLPDVARYLAAMQWRLERLGQHLRRDRDAMARVHALEHEHQRLHDLFGQTPELEELTWKLQELRVSLFAQPLGTRDQVSEQRIRRALQDIDSGPPARSQ